MNIYDPFNINDYGFEYSKYNFDYDSSFTSNPYIRAPKIPTNGTKIKAPYIADTYLVDNGKRRRIQDAATFGGIFRDWKGLLPWDLQSVPLGTPIVRGTILFKHTDSPRVYLYDKEDGRRWVKRFIVSPTTFNFFRFDWNKINQYSRNVFNPPNGTDIVARSYN
jgi:hypothetical protein